MDGLVDGGGRGERSTGRSTDGETRPPAQRASSESRARHSSRPQPPPPSIHRRPSAATHPPTRAMPTSQEADPPPSQRNLRSRTRICTATAAVPSRSLSTAAVAAAVDLSFRSPRRSCSPSISLGVTSPSSCGSAHHPRPALDHELATTATVRRPAKRVKAWDDPDFGESTGSEDEAEQLLLEEEDVIDISLHCGRSAMPTWSTPAVVGSDGEVDQVQEEGIVQGMEEDEEDEEDDDDELDSDDDEIEVIAQRVPPTLDASLRGPPILASSTSLSWSGPIPVISPSPATGTQGLLQNSEGEPVQPAYHPSPIRGSKGSSTIVFVHVASRVLTELDTIVPPGNKSEVYPSFIQGQRRWVEKRSHRAHPPELAPLRILPPIGDHRSIPSTQDPRVARLLENHYVPPPPHSRPQHSSSNMMPLHPPMGRPPPFRPPLPPRAMVNLPPSNYAALSPRWASHLSPAQSSGSGASPRHFPTPTAPFLMPLGLDGRSPAAPPGTHSPFRSPWMKDYDTGTSAAASQMHNLASGGIAPTPRRAGFTSLGGGVIAVTTPRVAGSWSKQPLMGAGYAVPGRIDEQAAPSLPTTAVSAPPAAEPLRVVFEDPPLPSAGRVEIAKGKRQVAFDPALRELDGNVPHHLALF